MLTQCVSSISNFIQSSRAVWTITTTEPSSVVTNRSWECFAQRGNTCWLWLSLAKSLPIGPEAVSRRDETHLDVAFQHKNNVKTCLIRFRSSIPVCSPEYFYGIAMVKGIQTKGVWWYPLPKNISFYNNVKLEFNQSIVGS